MGTKQKDKVGVSKRALIQRIDRQLRKDNDETLRANRATGSYYIVRVGGFTVKEKDVDLEQLGRKLGVLKPYERLGAA